jgi:putative ABC transport system permease protein
MKLWDIIKIANRNLFRNKLRTFLTVSAIFVGSFTLTLTNGLGDGLRNYVENQVKNLEAERVIFISKAPPEIGRATNGDEPTEYSDGKIDTETGIDPAAFLFTRAQIANVTKDIGGIRSITPRYPIRGEYITIDGGKKYSVELGMLSAGITQKTEAGRSIDGTDQIVLPLGLARSFDANIGNLIGKRAVLVYKDTAGENKTLSPEIVGVATKGFMTNKNSFVDSKTAEIMYNDQKSGDEADKFYSFSLQMESMTSEQLANIKRSLHEKGFEAETMADQKKRTYDAIGIFKTGMNFFAFIALLAASFGIINTLIIAVMERTKEIGLQKALGLGRGKIFLVFSLESILIGFWGATIGIIGGIVIGTIANKYVVANYLASFEGYNLFAFTLPSILFVLVLVSGIAFLAGVFPAIRASKLNPIESLRYE